MTDYTVLRDVSAAGTGGPFETGPRPPGTRLESLGAGAMPEPVIEQEALSKREVQVLSRDPSVLAVAPRMPTTLIRPLEVEGEGATSAWGIGAVGADMSSRTGAGVVVAVLDTGIDASHAAFSGVTLVQEDFSGSGNGDRQGHGTHCAGTIFGRDVDEQRIGVAVGVDRALIGKVLSDDGSGDSDMLFRGMQWAVDQGAQVLSMSLGFDFPGLVKRLVDQGWPADLATSVALQAYRANLRMFDALVQVIRRREPFGVSTVVVAAAGNESRRRENPDHEIGVSLPAAAEGVVSVGAVEQTEAGYAVASFSNTFPQVSGPGVDVLSARSGGGLQSLSGTSMATPHVAGVAALWWQEVKESALPATTEVVVARLLANAATSGFAPGVDVTDRGSGLVRAPA